MFLKIRTEHQGYLFVLPCLAMLAIVLGFPAVMAVANSFSPIWSRELTFTLANYKKLILDPIFWNSLRVSFFFVGGTVGLHFLVGMAVALALNSEIKARRFFRVLALLPWTVPDVISGLVWRYMYNPTQGVINYALMRVGLADTYVEWLASPHLAMPSIILADVWRGYPFVMVILLAGLQAIPKELYEAAETDGASLIQEFRHITLPSLIRPVVVALALDTIWQFRRFGLVYTMTQGGPGHTTEIFSLLVYKQYFRFFNFEYASSIAVIMAVILLLVSLPYLRLIVAGARE
ncbi:MAG: carbohydrate ABC transporter permease [bacterium]